MLENILFYQMILGIHILSLVIGHLLFVLASVSNLLFLHQEHQIKAKLIKVFVGRFPSLGVLKQISHRLMFIGFGCLTIGILLGIWLGGGVSALMRMELRLAFALLVWILYGLFLLEYLLKGYQGKRMALISLCLLFAVLIMEIGYFYKSSSLHQLPSFNASPQEEMKESSED